MGVETRRIRFIRREVILYVELVSVPDANVAYNVRAGLSRSESRLLASLSEKGMTIFGLKDVVAEIDRSYGYAKVLVNNLARKKWVIVLRRGTYLIVPLSAGVRGEFTEHEFVVASHLASPYYIAYWSALNVHGVTEQTPFTVFVATTKRVKAREILNVRYRFVTLSGRKFFGFEPVSVGSTRVNISDIEKTIVDGLDHPEYCGGVSEVANGIWNARGKIAIGKTVTYAKAMGNSAILKRLGFLLETLEIDTEKKALNEMRKAVAPGMSPLDPMLPRKGRYATRWNLLINVSGETLEEWRRGL